MRNNQPFVRNKRSESIVGIFKEKDYKNLLTKMGILFLFLGFSCCSFAQSPLPHYPEDQFSTYYHQKVSQFHLLPVKKGETIFLGNSITDGGSWSELFQDPHIINRGISGDVTKGVLNRLEEIIKRQPKKVFLLIGTNDLAAGITPDTIIHRIYRIVSLMHQYTPGTEIYVQSIFPVNKKPGKFPNHTNKRRQIRYINQKLKKAVRTYDYTYIDVYDGLKDGNGNLNLKYTNDGLHLLGAGYMMWKHIIYPYVYDLNEKPAIIPKPRNLSWRSGEFPLYQLHDIIVEDTALTKTAKALIRKLRKKGLNVHLRTHARSGIPHIILRLGSVDVPRFPEEAYKLHVDPDQIVIIGNRPHGVFNGIQTLRQLMRDGAFVDAVNIKDWPAFSWRGYMVDVGRNYQSMSQLKRQIDVMAHYKLNIFHFHLTEDVAWRLQIKRYPQLTKGKFMTRNKGQYYTIQEMHNLIQYCKDRYITLVPEIDMPGHSAAFQRAMGVDMQSDSGLKIMKKILTEVDTTYDIPYLHIGADEVEVTNQDFIPEMVHLIHNQGKETIGWAPGGNYDANTIRQLWQSEQPDSQAKEVIRYIDSRGVYLNHKDPLSGIPLIYNKQIGDVNYGDTSILGGEICLWNDDRAKNEEDILQMNAAYPAMLAMAERSWCGGGIKGLSTALGKDSEDRFQQFKEFESRLLDQKKAFFQNKPFPYFKQTNIHWQLFGPFDNKGKRDAKFWPERRMQSIADSTANKEVNGATIWLRHFFDPVISGVLKNPQPNTTYYAYRRIYSPSDTTGYFWIGFYDPSRSYAVRTPKEGDWDYRGSKLWINGKIISPPHWTYPGRNNGSQEDPIEDETYVSRSPTKVPLKKGWNSILVKAPVESFQGANWQQKVKWEFTVIRIK